MEQATNIMTEQVKEQIQIVPTLQTRKCACCGEHKPISEYSVWRNIKPSKVCKACVAKKKAETHKVTVVKEKEITTRTSLSQFTSNELIIELRMRGYKGELRVEQTMQV